MCSKLMEEIVIDVFYVLMSYILETALSGMR